MQRILLAIALVASLAAIPAYANAIPGQGPDVKLSFHIFKTGQDGWMVGNIHYTSACRNPPALIWYDGGANMSLQLPSCNTIAHLQPINGTDLTDITNHSIIIPEILNANTTAAIQYGNAQGQALLACQAFNPFTHGFYIRCPQPGESGIGGALNGNQAIDNTTELAVTVLNP